MAGATADPSIPEKVWNEKTWPMRAGVTVMRQQRVIGRVIGGIAEARQRKHGDEDGERIDQTRDGKCDRAERDARDQHDARADAVDQKARRRLQRSRDDIEGGERQRQIGIADAIVRAHEREQRRQQDHVIVADEMRGANRPDHAQLAKAAASGTEIACVIAPAAPLPSRRLRAAPARCGTV